MWNVVLVSEVDDWFITPAKADQGASNVVAAAIDLLAATGPHLGRPLVDRIKGAARHNMKELRPSGTSIRILCVFDPERQTVLLVAGVKAGNWTLWDTENIPLAESRYRAWLAGNYDEEVT